MPHEITLQINLENILVWIVVGLVAGFIASRVMLGHGLGLVGDIAVGVVGALVGAALATYFGVQISVAGHPFVSEILIAFFGAQVLLVLLRLTGLGNHRRRSAP